VVTDEVLVSTMELTGLVGHAADRREATLLPGTVIGDADEQLFNVGLAFHNLGDIDKQSVAGAFSTGTHGSGRTLRNLASVLVGGRLVTGKGGVPCANSRSSRTRN
jgi:FAD/FMN-containing dehydrogenase